MGNEDNGVSILLGFTIFTQVLFQCLLFVVEENKKDKIRIITVGIIYVIDMILAFMANMDRYIFLDYLLQQSLILRKKKLFIVILL